MDDILARMSAHKPLAELVTKKHVPATTTHLVNQKCGASRFVSNRVIAEKSENEVEREVTAILFKQIESKMHSECVGCSAKQLNVRKEAHSVSDSVHWIMTAKCGLAVCSQNGRGLVHEVRVTPPMFRPKLSEVVGSW
jgi:hypothetical protein